jgi:DNA (cytosine-5)-methyltransferase 1
VVIEKVIQLNKSHEWGSQPFQQNKVYSDYGMMCTLDTRSDQKSVFTNTRIRRLTPLECMRLQGYPDDYIKPCSDSQTYKQAGNSITVNVMKAIIKNLITVL